MSVTEIMWNGACLLIKIVIFTSVIILAASLAAGRPFFIAHPIPEAARNSLSFSPSPNAIDSLIGISK